MSSQNNINELKGYDTEIPTFPSITPGDDPGEYILRLDDDLSWHRVSGEDLECLFQKITKLRRHSYKTVYVDGMETIVAPDGANLGGVFIENPVDELNGLVVALHDAINRPKGVVPDSAVRFYQPNYPYYENQDRVSFSTSSCYVFDRWPLGINKSMDDHAAGMGLPHWSCVSPNNNEWWVRSDGHQCEPFYGPIPSTRGYTDVLKAYDKAQPISQNKKDSSST